MLDSIIVKRALNCNNKEAIPAGRPTNIEVFATPHKQTPNTNPYKATNLSLISGFLIKKHNGTAHNMNLNAVNKNGSNSLKPISITE
jgi:hypothetical protein